MSKHTPVSANRAVQLGRAMFNFGLKTRYVRGENPFSGMSLNRENQRDRVLTDKEAGKLLTALEAIPADHSNERTLRDWVLLSLMTGARKANILSMRWDEVDLKCLGAARGLNLGACFQYGSLGVSMIFPFFHSRASASLLSIIKFKLT
jgi:integrase